MSSVFKAAEQFWTTAAQLGFVSAEKALQAELDSKPGEAPTSFALARGLLSVQQCDIVETMLRPRETAPGYEILGMIGLGGMGVVYRARQLNLDRIVALKTIQLHQLGHQNAVQRFEHEAMAIGRLVHPHIVTAYDFGRHAGRLFLAMEIVEGVDADTWIARQGPMDEACAWQVIRQAAAGLAYAATQKLVHRDMKPANLLLVEPPAGYPLPPGVPLVKIADFGLAIVTQGDNLQTRLTTQGSAVGSPHYMAPEQFEANPIDIRADIYALGATAYHLLAGLPPWATLNYTQVLAKKITIDPASILQVRTDLSPASGELITAMMRCNPNDRPADYGELLRRIDRVLALIPSCDHHDLNPWAATRELSSTPTAATIELQHEPTKPTSLHVVTRPKSRRAWLFGSMAIGLFALIAILWFARTPWTSNVERDLRLQGSPLPLFNGMSLDPPQWRIEGGQWSPKVTDEDGYVLEAGAGAIVARRLERIGGEFPKFYRLQAIGRLSEGGAAELHFDGALAADAANHSRYVVRVSSNEAQLGMAASNLAATESIVAKRSLSASPDSPRELVIERHSQGWVIFVDGQLLGCLPPLHSIAPPEFRLKAIGGNVLFFDLEMNAMGK